MIPIHPTSLSSGTWHYGVVAQWWYEFNRQGPEIAYLEQLIPSTGGPVLDVGCGAGRVLLPLAKAGFDVDGADVSSDMLALCTRRASEEGLPPPRLYAQAIHELDLPRRYRTIYLCGTFGIGGRRDHDAEGLRRLHQQLEPGGTLVLDLHVQWNAQHWSYWLAENQQKLPEPELPEWDPRPASDGSALRLRGRVTALDPIEQVVTLQMLAERFRGGQLEAAESYVLRECIYFRHELELLLERAGLLNVALHGDHVPAPPTPTSKVLVFVARKP